MDKTAAIASCPRPKTETELRRFLGLAGYNRQTDLIRKGTPDWSNGRGSARRCLLQVKKGLCGKPLLYTPKLFLPSVLQTDGSKRGLGAVLS